MTGYGTTADIDKVAMAGYGTTAYKDVGFIYVFIY